MSIDIFTKQEHTSKGQIDTNAVYQFVHNNIEFTLDDNVWEAIDMAFAEVWNNKIGVGGYFYFDELPYMIHSVLVKKKRLISFDITNRIVSLMLEYIEKYGGLLD